MEELITELLREKEEIIFAYIFGSVVSGLDNKLSDVDLAIYVDEENIKETGSFGYRSRVIVELEKAVGEKIDLVILNNASVTLSYEILQKGKLLFTRSNSLRREFQENIMRKYLDFLPLLAVQEKYQKKRLREGRFGR
ncbi:type VII toxin-antitoxin system MntA family adenylyltransferase antitoxin [Halarsenatibacter silvermanii]|uniref:Predicted nucleotidyltransferase n=1 Tax=Halarsenatibacter silvermanii TaxID=321763 RepID=A0A1G9GTT4_9FIRM|nr:nucleotidyltransferase domain-containing protein [Halarsenatibacter silvermanii]SDL04087.1 Predicted nucleotidyltransferase [Halarsenatibacter silvermanii]